MKKFISNFWLKIIAIISMTFDHVGKILSIFYPSNETILLIENVFSIIGRFAFPIFVFLIIEGFYHTSNIKKYFIRLGGMAFFIFISMLIIGFIPNLSGASILYKFGNIFIDLFLILLFIFLINSKNIYLKLSSLLVLAYPVLSLIIQSDILLINNINTKSLLAGLLTQYSLVTPILLVSYAIFTILFNLHLKNKNIIEVVNIENAFYSDSFISRIIVFIFSISLVSLIMYAFTYTPNLNLNTDFVDNTYFILSIIPIYFYNDKLGLNNKIIKSAYYLYYPLSICIIYLIVNLTSIL